MRIINVSEIKSQKMRLVAIGLHAVKQVTKQSISALSRAVTPHIERLLAEHPNAGGTDVKRTVAIWGSTGNMATMLYASGLKPSELVQRVWNYAAETSAQRSGNVYLALKAQDKLLSACAAIVSGDMRTAWNKNKYLAGIVTLCEALDVSTISNADVYALYTSNKSRVDALCADLDADLRAKLTSAELYKSESTASTQRTTSANILQCLGAGVNAGNERLIYVDKESHAYQAIKSALFGGDIDATNENA